MIGVKNENDLISQYEIEEPHYKPFNRSDDGFKQETGNVKIMCVGDILCEEKLYKAHRIKNKFNFQNIYTYVRPLISEADFSICNLETTICESSPYTGESYKVDGKYHNNAPVEFLDAIQAAGFEFLITANNHCMDSGFEGAMETLDRIEERGLLHTGIFRPDEEKHYSIVERNGIKLAILGYTTWFNRNEERFTPLALEKIFNGYSKEKVERDIASARLDGAEFVIVYMHWGIDCEYKNRHTEKMSKMAQEVAEAGADYIVGSHPHAVQEYKKIFTKDKRVVPCAFSLGNFVTSEINMVSRENAMLSITLQKTRRKVEVIEEKFIPCFVPNKFINIPYPVVPEESYNSISDAADDSMSKAYQKIKSDLKQVPDSYGGIISKSQIYSALGLTNPDKDDEYSSVDFANGATKDSVAIISEINANPEYITSGVRYNELADIAIQRGAKLLISKEQMKDYPCLIVDDVYDAYIKIVTYIRNTFNAKSVAVTGSIGKTTTTQMISCVLNSKYKTLYTEKSANSIRSTSRMIQRLNYDHKYYVQEVMESPSGVPSIISKMLSPIASVVTAVGTSQIGYLGSQEDYLQSYLGIQDGLEEGGFLLLNGDDPIQFGAKSDKHIVYFGADNEACDYRAENIHTEGECTVFDIVHDGVTTKAKLNCFGKHYVLDACAAFALGKIAGMTDEEIVHGLTSFKATGLRQNKVKYGGQTIYMDCNNASLESIKSTLNEFGQMTPPHRKGIRIAVLGDIAECGNMAAEIHREVGKAVLDSKIDKVLFYGKDVKYSYEVVKQSNTIPCFFSNDMTEMVKAIDEQVSPRDIVLFKASNSVQLDSVVDNCWGTWFREQYEDDEGLSRVVKGMNYKFRLYSDHAIVIGKISLIQDVVIPEIFEGRLITGIGDKAFCETKYTKTITLPGTLKSIRYCAFYKADAIEEVTIPESVRIVYNSAFSTCKNLRKAVIKEGCSHLGYRAFGNCTNLEEIHIPKTVVEIGKEAFINCNKLKIYGEKGSFAQKYARKNRIPFAQEGENKRNSLLKIISKREKA